MNLLLVDPEELGSDAICTIRDRRASHVRSVIGASAGDTLRAGVIGGGIGTAEVIADDGTAITLRLAVAEPAPPALPVELVLAIPRPKVVSRVVETAAAFAVTRIDLTNAWRVDKSYLASPRLTPEVLDHAARLGAEQGATTRLPAIHVHRRLMAMFALRDPRDLRDDRRRNATRHENPTAFLDGEPAIASGVAPSHWPDLPACKLIAHPGAPPIETVVTGPPVPVVLAIGPEGGWITREIDTFVDRGFAPVSLGAPILRIEAAVAAALGQLLVLRRLGHRLDRR